MPQANRTGLISLERMDTNTEHPSFQVELLDLFDRNVPPLVLALNAVLAALLVLLLNGLVAPRLLASWWALVALVAVYNGWRLHDFRIARRQPGFDPEKWERVLLSGPLLNGIAWGIGGAALYLPSAPLQSMLVLLVICGVAAGIVASQSSLRRAPLFFLAPAILIPAVRILLIVTSTHALVALLLVIYLGFLLFVTSSNHLSVRESVRLRHHNERLLEALSESERHFRSLIENALDWVSVVKPDGTLLFQSPSVEELLGWSPDEMQGRNAFESVHPDDRTELERQFRLVLARGGVAAFDVRWRHRESHWVLVHILVRRLGKEEPSLVFNARDVTERRALEADLRRAKEAAEAASRVKDQFLASMSHEMRTPLHAIQGMADLMRETPLTAKQSEYVASFQEAGRHLAKLVNDVLDFSRMNAGALTLASDPFDLRRLLTSVVTLMGLEAEAKGLRLHLDISTDILPVRLGDATRLRQVLVNLVGNAVKFTDQGEITIQVTPDGERLQFVVADTGRGIPPEKQGLLFKPFSQVDSSSTREFAGVGLGLAISRGLVEAMGGRIGVDSAPGRGSRFHFSVPLPSTRDASPPEISEEGQELELPPARILVADDAELNQLVIREFFRNTRCRLDFVQTGREAVEACEKHLYDLVLMDIQMPDMDGWEATRVIRDYELREGRQPMPIIALTAGALDQDRVNALTVGCTDFLAKPITKAHLLAHVAMHLGKPRVPAGAATRSRRASRQE